MAIAEHLLLPLGNSNGGRHDELEVAQELYEWWSKEWLCETKEKAWCRGVGSRDLPDDYNYASLRDSTRALEQ